MPTCANCKFETALDDVAVPFKDGDRCICLRCYRGAIGEAKSQLRAEREAVETALQTPESPASSEYGG